MPPAGGRVGMVFKRRVKPSLPSRIRAAILPKRGYRRGVEYLGHRVRRLPDTPHRVALGFACGIFSAFTPLFGVHILFAAAVARLIRANVVAALIGTTAGNPLTYPLIAPVALGLGRRILGHAGGGHDYHRVAEAFIEALAAVRGEILGIFGLGHGDWGLFVPFFREVLWPYFVGGLIPGLVAGAAAYWLVRPLVTAYQARRRARLVERAHGRALARIAAQPHPRG